MIPATVPVQQKNASSQNETEFPSGTPSPLEGSHSEWVAQRERSYQDCRVPAFRVIAGILVTIELRVNVSPDVES